MHPEAILETSLYVSDLDRARSFYQRVLGLEVHSTASDRHVFFRCGQAMLLLFNPEQTSIEGGSVPSHGARGPGHVAFRVSPDDLDAWRERLQRESCPVEMAVEWPSGGRSIYFRDPDGNSLELATPATWGLR